MIENSELKEGEDDDYGGVIMKERCECGGAHRMCQRKVKTS